MNINDDGALGFMDRLLERLRQADLTNFGSHIEVVYVTPGAQHVDHIGTQVFGETHPESEAHNPKTLSSPPCVGREEDAKNKESFNDDTPLSALFRENHHEKLRKVIDSWRPYLIGGDASVNALAMTRFEFNKERIYSNKVYRDLCELDTLGALQVSLSQLARYLSAHSNLSRSYATLYQQLKNYRNENVTYSP